MTKGVVVSVKLVIDKIEAGVSEGMTILDAAQRAAIYIGCLCSHPNLLPVNAVTPGYVVNMAVPDDIPEGEKY